MREGLLRSWEKYSMIMGIILRITHCITYIGRRWN